MSKLNAKIEQLLVDLKQVRTDNKSAVRSFNAALKKANAIAAKLEQAEVELSNASVFLSAVQKKVVQTLDKVTKVQAEVKHTIPGHPNTAIAKPKPKPAVKRPEAPLGSAKPTEKNRKPSKPSKTTKTAVDDNRSVD